MKTMTIYKISIHLTYLDDDQVTHIDINKIEMDYSPDDYITRGKVGYDTYEYNHFARNKEEIHKKVMLYKNNNLEHFLLNNPNGYLLELFTSEHINRYPELYI